MTNKQEIFTQAYLGVSRFNATDAARRAGYACPKEEGYRLKRRPDIAAVISERMADLCMEANEVLARLAEHARGSLQPFLREVNGELWPDLTTDEAQQHLHLLKKIKPKKRVGGSLDDQWTETEIELELHDPQAALVHIGRHHKLFTDRLEQNLSKLSDAELRAIIAEEEGR
jgi:phage terminase small subunit